MKSSFTAGVALLLPIVLTFMIVDYLVNFVTTPFLDPMKAFLHHIDLFYWTFFQDPLITILSKLLILLILITLTLGIGFLAEIYILKVCLRYTDRLLHALPIFNKIYKLSQDTIHSLFSSQKQTFSHAVGIPFPNEESSAVGLVAQSSLSLHHVDASQEELSAIFVPGAINPTFGFIILYRKEEELPYHFDVSEAMKMLISCGATAKNSPSQQSTKNEI